MGNKGYQVKEVTPKGMRCMAGPCPEVYEVKSASPQEMGCLAGPCPELYSVGEDYLIVGRAVSLEEAREVRLDDGRNLADRVGGDEHLIRISKNLVNASVLQTLAERIIGAEKKG